MTAVSVTLRRSALFKHHTGTGGRKARDAGLPCPGRVGHKLRQGTQVEFVVVGQRSDRIDKETVASLWHGMSPQGDRASAKSTPKVHERQCGRGPMVP